MEPSIHEPAISIHPSSLEIVKKANPLVTYLKKFQGQETRTNIKYLDFKYKNSDILRATWSLICAFIAIAILQAVNDYLMDGTDFLFIVPSVGAAAVLVYSQPDAPLAQPRNLIFGNVLGAFIGVTMQLLLGSVANWLAAALAVALTIFFMEILGIVHPPAGATALIAVIGPDGIKKLGYLYILVPVLSSFLVMMIVAMLVMNIYQRSYPKYWI